MRRRRKRTRLRVKPFMVLALVANIAAGMIYSPITSVVRLRVDGAAEWDRDRIQQLAQNLQDTPCALVSKPGFDSSVLSLPEARTASLARNPFGSAVLRIRYRRAVARVSGPRDLALTIDGVVYPVAVPNQSLPVIELPPDRLRPALTVAGVWPAAGIADLSVRLHQMLPEATIAIRIADDGNVWLNMNSGQVVLGSLDSIDEKLRVLKTLLAANPDFLSAVESLNLVAPAHPRTVPKKDLRTQ